MESGRASLPSPGPTSTGFALSLTLTRLQGPQRLSADTQIATILCYPPADVCSEALRPLLNGSPLAQNCAAPLVQLPAQKLSLHPLGTRRYAPSLEYRLPTGFEQPPQRFLWVPLRCPAWGSPSLLASGRPEGSSAASSPETALTSGLPDSEQMKRSSGSISGQSDGSWLRPRCAPPLSSCLSYFTVLTPFSSEACRGQGAVNESPGGQKKTFLSVNDGSCGVSPPL